MTVDRWLVLTVRVPSEELTEELAEGLLALGGSAVEEDADLLTTYVPEPADPETFLRDSADRLAVVAGEEPDILWRWQPAEDWSRRWKEGLEPRRVGRRLVVTQPWNPVEDDGRLVLVIDPSSAFGTGEHPTTRGALRLMEQAITGGERVLDVGAGSGILSIAAVKLGARSVLAVEVDEGAMQTAGENLERNRVAGVELVNARVDAELLEQRRGDGYDLIAANVLSSVLTPLLPALAAALRPGGGLILGGILQAESADVVSAAAAAGLRLESQDLETGDRDGEWWTGLLSCDRR